MSALANLLMELEKYKKITSVALFSLFRFWGCGRRLKLIKDTTYRVLMSLEPDIPVSLNRSLLIEHANVCFVESKPLIWGSIEKCHRLHKTHYPIFTLSGDIARSASATTQMADQVKLTLLFSLPVAKWSISFYTEVTEWDGELCILVFPRSAGFFE